MNTLICQIHQEGWAISPKGNIDKKFKGYLDKYVYVLILGYVAN